MHADWQSCYSAAVRNLTKSASPPHRHPSGCHLPAPAWHQTAYPPHPSAPHYALPVRPRHLPVHSHRLRVPGCHPGYHSLSLPHPLTFPGNRYPSLCSGPVQRTVTVPSVPDLSWHHSADMYKYNPPSGNSLRQPLTLHNPLP